MEDKNFAWELFKNTGNIDAYMLMKDVQNTGDVTKGSMNNVIGDNNGNNKNQGNSY